MIHITYENNGRPVQCADRLDLLNTAGLNILTIPYGDPSTLPTYYKIENLAVVDLGRPPDVFSVYDYDADAWVDGRSAAEIADAKENEARRRRDTLLRQTDWTQLPDAPLTAQKLAQWQIYRQSLRDLPAQANFPDISWPVDPDGNM